MTVLPDVLQGCEVSSLTVREEHELRIFQNKLLKKIFGPKKEQKNGENYIMRNLTISTL
jgi:hypothetical protein